MIKLVQAIEDKKHFYIVTEYKSGGTLVDLFRQVRGQMAFQLEALAKQIIRDVATGLNDLHAIGIVHRDIKPLNILIDKRNMNQQ